MTMPPTTSRTGQVRSLSCPSCGSPVRIRASGLSITAVCESCRATLDVANEQVRLIAEAHARTETPLIPIGRRGTLAGTEWEVVGFQRRSSEAGSWSWAEYLLFNPYRGFRFLGHDHGHWTLYGMLRRDVDDPTADGGDGRRYRLTETVAARTEYVLGEFYWRVRAGDTVTVREFVHPPFLLSEERAEDEVTWSRGRYLEPATVGAAFKLDRVPPRTGRAAHQVEPPRRRLWPVAVASLIGLVILDTNPAGQGLDSLVFQQVFTVAPSDQDHGLPAVPLSIPYSGGNLRVAASMDGGQGMLHLDVSLVRGTGYARQDASFTLGSFFDTARTGQTALFSSVSGGAATLLIRPHSSAFPDPDLPGSTPDTPPSNAVSFLITVRRHVHDPVNLLLAGMAILLWPLASALRRWARRIGGHAV